MYLPEDDKMFDTKGSMYNHIVSCMGGRVAELRSLTTSRLARPAISNERPRSRVRW